MDKKSQSDTASPNERITKARQQFRGGGQGSRRRTGIRILRAELNVEKKWLLQLGDASYGVDYYDQALDTLDEADAALDRHDPISSRKAYYSAQRMAVLGLADMDEPIPEQSVSRSGGGVDSQQLVHEAESEGTDPQLSVYRKALLRKKALGTYIHATQRLRGYREELCDELLTTDGQLKEDVDAIDLAAALQLLEEYYLARDLIYAKLKRQLNFFVGFASLTLLALLGSAVTNLFGPVLADASQVAQNRFLVYVVLFGILGASMSAILSLSRRFVIGELIGTRELVDFPMALARVVAGGISALVLFVILQSGVFNAIFEFDFGAGLALTLALAAGFSEELVRSSLDNVSGRIIDQNGSSRN